MHEERLVEDWCFEIGLENEGWLDSGDFGNAFTISDDKVIKITRDHSEFIQTFSILGKGDDPYLPKVFDMRIFKNEEMGILMEELIRDSVDDLFSSWLMEADDIQEVDLFEIDLEESFLSDEVIKMVNDLEKSMNSYKKNGVDNFDIHAGNIGINSHGNYVLFDQNIKNQKKIDYDLLQDIKEKLMDSYCIEDEYVKENVPMERIVADIDSMHRTFLDIKSGKISQTKGEIECMYNEWGGLQVIDGYHRLCEALLKGDEEIDVLIGFDERYGYSHPTYTATEKDDAMKLDGDLEFSGLEELYDEEYLRESREEYLELKTGKEKNECKKSKKRSLRI